MEFIDSYFAEKMGGQGESERAFLSELIKVSREGHLCLDLAGCDKKVQEGAQSFSSPYIHRFENLCYWKRNWVYETRVIDHLNRLMGKAPSISYHSSELTPKQQEAVNCALRHQLSIITGGPGTGKTFIARHLIEAMPSRARVLLAAPTGKAAARLQMSNPSITCGTLHALLEIRSDRDLLREGSYLNADLIVVDECSMIDVRLLSYFLASIHKGARVVLMGDADQLPPIESGSIFSDLIEVIPTAHLTESLRSDRKEVLDLASAVRKGEWKGEIFPLEDLWKETRNWSWEEMRILSCLRKGPWGVNAINRQVIYRNNLKNREFDKNETKEIPILITRTDYRLGLYNGETGVLRGREAFFPNSRRFPIETLPDYEYGYCLSVHKSQGSEFNTVLLVVPPGSEVFGKEMLYTAVTRARSSIKVFGDLETIEKSLQHVGRKISGIRARLRK